MTKKKKPKIIWHLEKRKIRDLKNFHKNPRIISDHMFKKLKESLIEDGIIEKPYITTDDVIIGGHQRKEAFLQLGIEEVECWIPHRELTEKEIERINLKGNKINGEWDYEILASEWDTEVLEESGFLEEELLGISTEDFDDIKKEEQEEIDEETPEAPKEAKTVKGDLYEFGKHRLLCGDAVFIDDVEKLLDGCSVDMVYTDPPYGINEKCDRKNQKRGTCC